MEQDGQWTTFVSREVYKALEEAGAVVAFSLNLVQIIVTVLKPVLPQMCAEIEKQMGLEDGKWPQDREFFTLQEGEINYSAPLLSRVDQKKIDALLAEQTEGNSPEPAKAEVSPKSSGGRIDFKQFEKVVTCLHKLLSLDRSAWITPRESQVCGVKMQRLIKLYVQATLPYTSVTASTPTSRYFVLQLRNSFLSNRGQK